MALGVFQNKEYTKKESKRSGCVFLRYYKQKLENTKACDSINIIRGHPLT